MANPSDEEMRNELKRHIDEMSSQQLRNVRESKKSFWLWVKSTIERIWGYIVQAVIEAIVNSLWPSISS
jgi:hypothetical protein